MIFFETFTKTTCKKQATLYKSYLLVCVFKLSIQNCPIEYVLDVVSKKLIYLRSNGFTAGPSKTSPV